MQQLDKSFRELSPEEQQTRAKDFSDQVAQLARNAQRKAEAILTPQQLQVGGEDRLPVVGRRRAVGSRPCKRSSASARSNVSG